MELENTFTVPAGIDEAWAAFNDPRRVAPCFPGATLSSYEDDTFNGTVKVKLGPISLTYKGKGTFVERDEAAHKVVIEASGRDARGNGTASATVTGTLTPDGPDKTSVKMVTDMTVTGRPAQFGRGVMADVSDKIVGQFASCLAKKLGSGEEAGAAGAGAAASASAGTAGSGESEKAGAASAPAADGGATPGTSGGESSAGAVPTGGSAGVATATATPASAAPPSVNGSAPKPAFAADSGPAQSEVEAINLLDTAGAPVLKRLAPVVAAALLLLIVLRVVKSRKS
ncbi:MAG TPA: SRPBCC family protein [Pseudonocardia sp.]|jgi:carbon monoxide dehydrogenase subunit G